jgi:lipopolysaccharide transport system permease protein
MEAFCSSAAPARVRHLANPVRMASSLWRYRQMIWQFVVRDVRARYMGSSLGFAWSLIPPLVMLAMYTFVFGKILKAKWGSSTSDNYGEFSLILFCGLMVYGLFSECASRAPSLIIGNGNLVKKVVFPLEILPVAAVGTALFNTLINLGMILLATAIFMKVSWTVVLIVPLFIPVIFYGLAAGWLFSSLAVFARDVGQALPIVLQLLMFGSPVFYDIHAVKDLEWLIRLNPLSVLIEGSRAVLLFGRQPEWEWVGISTLIGFCCMQISYIFFMKTKAAFSDVL